MAAGWCLCMYSPAATAIIVKEAHKLTLRQSQICVFPMHLRCCCEVLVVSGYQELGWLSIKELF